MLRHRQQDGYSAIEIAIAMLLSASILATAAPTVSSIVAQHRFAAASRQLAFEISRARMEAVGQNTFTRLVLVGNDAYQRQRSTDGVTFTAEGPVVSLPTGLTIQVDEAGAPRFNRQGMAAAATAFVISGSRGSTTVRVNVLGRTTVL